MHDGRIRKLVIAGGGTAGWMAAAMFAHHFGKTLDIALVESDEIGTVGVGEATIPPLHLFHKYINVSEPEFLRAVQGTFKLGIFFENWRNLGENYFGSFGWAGREHWAVGFQNYWLRGHLLGLARGYGEYCLETSAALRNRFAISLNTILNYAYHIDAGLYGQFLRGIAEESGVIRHEGRIDQVEQDPANGFITGLRLQSGQRVMGDLFIDCTGFRGLLIGQTLNVGFDDYGDFLFCDRAIAVPTAAPGPLHPYTRATAHEAGWQWRIPLQHRVGNGMVFSSRHWSDDEARARLLDNVQGTVLAEPRLIRFRAGQRRRYWHKNCVALGLASGFMEPLESTSIHLIQRGITHLVQLFPDKGIREPAIAEFNAKMQDEIDNIRDFLIFHYHVTNRSDTPFWRQCQTMDIPDSLTHRIQLFRQTGRIAWNPGELFGTTFWVQVMLGQGLIPEQYHPIVNAMSKDEIGKHLVDIHRQVEEQVEQLPDHQQFIDDYCKAPPV